MRGSAALAHAYRAGGMRGVAGCLKSAFVGSTPPAEQAVAPALDTLEAAPATAVGSAPLAEQVVAPALDTLETAPAADVGSAPPAEQIVAPAVDTLEPAPAAAVDSAPPAEQIAAPALHTLGTEPDAAGDIPPGRLKFALDDQYRLPTTTWSAYLDHIHSTVPNDVEELQASITVYVAIVLALDENEQEQDSCVEATLTSIQAANSNELVDIQPVALGKSAFRNLKCYSSVKELAENISDGRTYVLFLKAGDEVSDAFSAVLVRGLSDERDLLFFDMWQRSKGKVLPILLPGANPILALNKDYFYSRFLISGSAIREECASAEVKAPYDLALGVLGKAYEAKKFQKYGHLPFPMICLSENEAEPLVSSEPFRYRFPGAKKHGVSKSQEERTPSVSVVICTRNKGQLLFQLVNGILNQKNSLIEDVVIVANNTDNPLAIERHRILSKSSKVKFVEFTQPFNFSAQSNLGARNAKGNTLLFLNDDIVPVTEDWVAELLRPLESERIAMAGALLLYPNERVQHAGMFLGFNGICGHTLRHAALPEDDYCGLLSAPRNVSCTTGACQMIKRDVFEDLNGFDEAFATYIQDVDLCIRVRESGYDIAWTPSAVLLHVESPSVKEILANSSIELVRKREHDLFVERWGEAYLTKDPFHNPNFSINDERLREIV